MSSVVLVEDAELVPVLELEPSQFATERHPSPSAEFRAEPEAWHRYWEACLADSGLVGVVPIQPGSWHVATRELGDPARLRRLLEVIFGDQGRGQSLSEPDNMLPLNGGLALRSRSQGVLVTPTCCADLGNIADWREAVDCRQAAWQMVWIGHPWLSVRFDPPRLIISAPHESESPTARWAVSPDHLESALAAAEAEQARFATRLAAVLPSLGYGGDVESMGRKLAGLDR
jgi:hypothetical protein